MVLEGGLDDKLALWSYKFRHLKFLMDPTSIPMLEHAFSYVCTSIKSVSMKTLDSLSKLKYITKSNVSYSNHIWAFLLKCNFS